MSSGELVPLTGGQLVPVEEVDRQVIFSTLMAAVMMITEQSKPLNAIVEDYFLLANSEPFQAFILPTEQDPNEQLVVFYSTYVDILLEDCVSFHRIDLADKVHEHYTASKAGQHRPVVKHWSTR